MPIHTRGRVIAFDGEATPGTAETITAVDGATIIMARNARVTPRVDVVDREQQGSLAYHTSVLGAKAADVAASLLGIGSGTNTGLVLFHDLLLASGLTHTVGGSSVSYVPLLGATATATFAMFKGPGAGSAGVKRTAAGAMFNLTITGRTGQAPEFAFEGSGVYFGQTNVTVISPTYLALHPPKWMGGTCTVGGTTVHPASFTLNLNNQIVLRESPSAVDADSRGTGYIAAWVANTRTTLTLDPEKEVANDYDAIHHGGTATSAIVIAWGNAAGNSFRISMAAGQIIDTVGDDEREGREVDSLNFLGTGATPVTIATE